MAIAWVFPGQGSQKLGMADPVLSLSGASQRFAMASELLAVICWPSARATAVAAAVPTTSTTPATRNLPCLSWSPCWWTT